MAVVMSASSATKVVLFVIMVYLWNIECVSSQAAVTLLTPVIMWMLLSRRFLRRITQNEVIVLTGCDSGLGYSVALHCHEHLSAKVIAGVHNSNSLGAHELRKNGITVQEIDITDSRSIENFVQFSQAHLKQNDLRLRAFINNAGVMVFGEFDWSTEAQIRQQVEVNLLGTMRLTKAVLPLLREYKSRLMVVTSHCATEALPGVATYAATKAGLSAWTTALRMELKKFGISVVNFIPGSFVTDSNLLSRQIRHFRDMENEMCQETAAVYGEYFQVYQSYLRPLARDNARKRIKDNSLYSTFEHALMEEPPKATYKCEPWRYTLYHSLLKFAPTTIHDFLVQKFIQMPVWRSPNSATSDRDRRS